MHQCSNISVQMRDCQKPKEGEILGDQQGEIEEQCYQHIRCKKLSNNNIMEELRLMEGEPGPRELVPGLAERGEGKLIEVRREAMEGPTEKGELKAEESEGAKGSEGLARRLDGLGEASQAATKGEVAGPSQQRLASNSPPRDKLGEYSSDTEMERLVGQIPRTVIHHSIHAPPEVILKTQLLTHSRTRGSVYNNNMASIGLNSPTPSQEIMRGEDNHASPGAQHVNTTIRNSASSLMALGKHVLTPRHGRIWEFRNKSPLGGKEICVGGSLS